MSRFAEALERAEQERAVRSVAVPPSIPEGDSTQARPAASSEDSPLVERAPVEPSTVGVSGTATLGELADVGGRRVDDRLVSLLRPASFEAEQYRVLRHIVETLRRSKSLQILAVTSPGTGDGKTTTAINLAGALAQAPSASVLLAEIDFRSPAVARQLGLEDSHPGFRDVLVQPELTLGEAVRRLPEVNLSVVPAGRGVVSPYEALKSPRLDALLAGARQTYDYIVLDAPPFVPVPDCRLIAGRVDGFLIVVAADRTPRKGLAEVLRLLDPAKVLGLVFNRDRGSISSYYGVNKGWLRRGRQSRPRQTV